MRIRTAWQVVAKSLSVFLCSVFFANVSAGPSTTGQSGLINMPDARMEENGILRFGYSGNDPYTAFWSSITLLPRLELSARYTRIKDISAFGGNSGYGDIKDKSFDAKLLVWPESRFVPQMSFGLQDYLGTQLFKSYYAVANKKIKSLDFSIGYGLNRISGLFGGVTYRPSWFKNISLLMEYDAYDYKNDPYADQSHAQVRSGGLTFGINYQWSWLGAQLAYQNGEIGFNSSISIPLGRKEFVPKIHEPPPLTKQRVDSEYQKSKILSADQERNESHGSLNSESELTSIVLSLGRQGFKNTQVQLDNNQLNVGLSHNRISLVSRTIGRATRTILYLKPDSVEKIRITYYTTTDLPVVTYYFSNLEKVDLFFQGELTYLQLLEYVKVTYAEPEKTVPVQATVASKPINLAFNAFPEQKIQIVKSDDGHFITFKKENRNLSNWNIAPLNVRMFFNDPSGAYRYDAFVYGNYVRQLGRGLFFNSSARLRLYENVSGVKQASNSTLPHVRTDVADYKRSGIIKMDTLLLNKFLHIRPRLYGRLSLGYYEEMFAGSGGQLLFFPKQKNWAVDLSLDWVRQRDTGGGFTFRSYHTVTTLGSLHYRIPKWGLTFTVRAGQFLAQDIGMRFEFQRRFRSGFRIGAWYTITNGNDITGPGSDENPYNDKGVFMRIPLSTMLAKDTRASGGFSLAPWTRDVGQMVHSPQDLYQIVEDPLLFDTTELHLLSDFEK